MVGAGTLQDTCPPGPRHTGHHSSLQGEPGVGLEYPPKVGSAQPTPIPFSTLLPHLQGSNIITHLTDGENRGLEPFTKPVGEHLECRPCLPAPGLAISPSHIASALWEWECPQPLPHHDRGEGGHRELQEEAKIPATREGHAHQCAKTESPSVSASKLKSCPPEVGTVIGRSAPTSFVPTMRHPSPAVWPDPGDSVKQQ